MFWYRYVFTYLVALALALILLFLPYWMDSAPIPLSQKVLRVLTYSSFVQDWGPGPEIADLFAKEKGIEIRWINAGNAGLLLERLKFKSESDQPDLVLGFDQFSLPEARKTMDWLDVQEAYRVLDDSILPQGAQAHDFLAYDWGPMTFIYREGEIEPPRTLDDLLKDSYASKLILQDPRMSSPGLQFLFWVLHLKGEEKGFEYLNKIKKSIKVLSPSWSSGYSIFQMEKGTMAFSYFTSPFYHELEEGDHSYKTVIFDHPHPLQVEYAGIPESCLRCDEAKSFLAFMLRPDIQKIIMRKNFMYPASLQAIEGSQFHLPKQLKLFDPIESWTLMQRKKELVKKWKEVYY